MELLTQTKRRDFQNCRRYYYNRHVLMLALRSPKGGRRRGSAFGDALQAVRDAQQSVTLPHGDGMEYRLDFTPAVRSSIMDSYEPHLLEARTSERNAELELEMVKIECMAIKYVERYGVDQRREIEYTLPLRNPRTKRTSRRFQLGGKIDGTKVLAPHRAKVIEDKFVGQIQKVMIERLPLDVQTTEYVDAFLQMGWECEVEYRHTRLPSINPLKGRKLKTKEHPAETLDEFRDRLLADVDERPEFYFDVQHLSFPVEHMEEFRGERWEVAQQILAAVRQGRSAFPRNPSRCWEYGGCEFIPMCARHEDHEALYVVVPDNPELGIVQSDTGEEV